MPWKMAFRDVLLVMLTIVLWGVDAGFRGADGWVAGVKETRITLPDDLGKQERSERTRREQEEFVFSGTWGSPASW